VPNESTNERNPRNAFEAYWAKGEFRAAYQLIEKILQTSALGNTEHYKKADQDFYWEFIA
jgi:hypothetical protein